MAQSGLNRIGKYEIQAELGRGGFGRVYRAFDPAVGRPVAIKILTAEAGKDLLTRFRNEAAAAGNLHHRNIVTVYEFGEHKGVPFIAMEFLEGEDLQQILAEQKPLTILEKVSVMVQAAGGLDYAHRRGVVHRDVKPGNIRLLPDGTVKIMDFGIARVVSDTGTRLTRQGHVIGTLLYMAPEQISGAEVDSLCDIFSFGVTCYELLTGQHPFQALDPRTVFYKITSEEPAPIRNLAPECPDSLDQIVRRALHKERELRYQSLQDLQYDAEAVLMELRQERAAALLAEATELAAREEMDRAHTILHQIIELDPGNRAARRLRDTVQGYFRRRAVQPRIDALMEKAAESGANRSFGEAVGHLEAALRLDAENDPVLARLREIREAADRCERAEQLMAQARTEYQRDNLAGAFQAASEALEIDPEHPDVRPLLGIVQVEIDRREKQRRLRERLRDAQELLLVHALDDAAGVIAGLDADDRETPEARELSSRIEQQKRESERQARLRSELAAARELLDKLRFGEAVERLQRLKAESPTDERVSGLLNYAQQELRKLERAQALDRLRGQVLELAESKEFARALSVLDEASREYGVETGLVRLRQRVRTAQSKWEREQAIQQAVRRAEGLAGENRYTEALAALDADLKHYPGERILEALRQRIEQDAERARRAAAVQDALERGEALIEAGDPDGAAACLERAAGQYSDPRLKSALALAREAIEAKRRAEAIEAVRREIQELADQREFDHALRAAEAGLSRFAGEAVLERLRAEVLTAKARWEREQAIRDALEHAGRLGEDKRFDEALRAIDECTARYPDPELAEARRRLQAAKSRHEQEEAVRAAVAEAAAWIENRRPKAAVEVLERVLETYPGEPELAAALARARDAAAAQQRADAIAKAQQAARSALDAGQFDRAIRVLDGALSRYPGAAALAQSRAESVAAKAAWLAEQEVAAALRDAEAASSEGRLADAERILAAALWKHSGERRLEDARRSVAAALEQQQRAEAILHAVEEADAYVALGDPRRAMAGLKQALGHYAGSSELERALARAEDALRETERSEVIDRIEAEARNRVEDEQFERALESIAEAMHTHGDDRRLIELRGWALTQRALFECEQDVDRILRKTEALASEGAFEEALQVLAAGLDRYPDNAALTRMRADVEERWERQRREQAIRSALAEAESSIAAGDPERAIARLETAQKTAPGAAEIERVLTRAREASRAKRLDQTVLGALRSADALAAGREFDRALQVLDEALKEAAEDGRLTQARRSVADARSRFERQQAVARELARLDSLVAGGDLAAAGRALEEALGRYPGETGLLEFRGRLQEAWNRREREDRLKRTVAEADAAVGRGDPRRAVEVLETALARLPGEHALIEALERAREAAQQRDRQDAVEQVCRETRVYLENEEFDRALETVECSLGVFEGERRLQQLRENVVLARTRYEERLKATRLEQPAATRSAATSQAVTDEPLLPGPPPVRDREPPPRPPEPVPEPPPRGGSGRRNAILAAAVILAAALGYLGYTLLPGSPASSVLAVTTSPEGATIRVGDRTCVTPGCRLPLARGTYRVQAALEGYKPQEVSKAVNESETTLRLALEPLPSSIELSSDLKDGRVLLDGKPAGRLQDGQWRGHDIAAGRHVMEIASSDGAVSLTFKAVPGQASGFEGGIQVRGEIDAVAISSLGSRAVVTCGGCSDLTLDGRAIRASAPMEGLGQGTHELKLKTSAGTRTVSFRSGAEPALLLHASSARNSGLLLLETGVDSAAVWIDGKRQGRGTSSGGQFRAPLDAGEHRVRVEAPGFKPAETRARILKGEELRAVLKLEPLPAGLAISGALAGTRVAIDGRPTGSAGADGRFSIPDLATGEHEIELARDGYQPRQFRRTFERGRTVELNGAEVRLAQLPPPKPPEPPKPKPDPAAEAAAAEARAWLQAQKGGAAEVEAFLRAYPRSGRAAEARSRLEELDWKSTDQNNAEALRQFLSRHESGPYAGSARAQLGKLQAEMQARLREQQMQADQNAVRAVLKAYAAAHEQKDIDAVRKLRANLSDQELRGFRELFGFGPLRFELNPMGEPRIADDGRAASVTCVLKMQVTDQRGNVRVAPPRKISITLAKSGGRWVIQSWVPM